MSPEHKDYLNRLTRRKRLVSIARVAILVAIAAIWEACAAAGYIDPFITSSPSRIAETTASLYRAGDLFLHIGTTLLETVVSFAAGTLIGILLAVVLWWSPTLSKILDPYLVVLNALPKIALGPILIVWIGAGIESIIVMGLLISVIVMVISMLTGFLEISEEKHLLMRTLGATKAQILLKVVLPASVPAMIAALKISVSMSWVGVIVGEYLVSKAGLGYLIVYGGQVFQLDLVMTSIVILCILAGIMYYGVAAIEKKLVRR